jgi:endonuclease G
MPMGIVPVVSRQSALASAQRSVELFEDVQALCARPEGLIDLGVIEWLLRPALLLSQGSFAPIQTGPWKDLKPDSASSISQVVCRVDISLDPSCQLHLGTAFLIGWTDSVHAALVTNAHVIEAARQQFGWPTRDGIELVVNFRCEATQLTVEYLRISTEVRFHPQYDLAVMSVMDPDGILDRNIGLTFCETAPEAIDGIKLGVVGHPSFNSNLDPFPKIFGFGDLFGVKRFSPGFIQAVQEREWRRSLVQVALHDASTLSGSSGSCVFDLVTGMVLGLHFGGWPKHMAQKPDVYSQNPMAIFEANGAVPIWLLKSDSVFHGLDLTWG